MFKMVEAGGVESSQVFAVTRDHVISFVFLQTLFFVNRTRTHHREDILSRPVPSDRGGGGGASLGVGSLIVMDSLSANFFTKGH